MRSVLRRRRREVEEIESNGQLTNQSLCKMSSLLGVIHKSGAWGGQLRTVTTQAALVNSSCWLKQEETCRENKILQQELQKNYDEAFHNFLSLNSSLHQLYKIDSKNQR